MSTTLIPDAGEVVDIEADDGSTEADSDEANRPKGDCAADPAGAMDLRDDEPASPNEPATISAIDHDHVLLADIRTAEASVSEAEAEWLEAKEVSNEKKKVFETRVADLRSVIRRPPPAPPKPDPPLPLFDAADGLDKPAGTNGQPAPGNDAWRSLCIDTLALPATVLESMREKGIETLGGFANFQRERGEFWAKDLKGVGPAKETKITEAWAAFWKANPQYCEQK